MKKNSKAKIEKKESPKKSLVQSPKSVVVNPKDLKAYIAHEKEVRGILTEYISSELKKGVDFGTIKFGSGESKPSLFKPGSEKFCAIMHLRPTFEKDADTWDMSGKEEGLFCYVCKLVNEKGVVVGEGRGAANLKEKKGWIANNAIKISQKRAQVDAVLRTGQLSDFFTQDIEDMNPKDISSNGGTRTSTKSPSQEEFQKFYGRLPKLTSQEDADAMKKEINASKSLTEKQKKYLCDLSDKRIQEVDAGDIPF